MLTDLSPLSGTPNRKFPSGFTLIELLVVIAIIAILAALVLRTAGFVQTKGATSRAQAEIAAISTALESYKVDYGDYPTNSTPAVNTTLINSLINSNATYNPLGKVYLSLPKNSIAGTLILDPFGTAYNYQYPGNTNRSGSNFFDLWSFGGNSGNSNKWVKNW